MKSGLDGIVDMLREAKARVRASRNAGELFAYGRR